MLLSFDTVWRKWWNGERTPAEPHPAETPEAHAPSKEAPWLSHLDAASIPRHLVYPATTLGRILDQSADRFGDAEAILYNHHRWTYRELLASVNRMAGAFAHLGVRRGERVLLVLPNCPEFVIAFFAIQKLGAVVVNAGPLMGRDDLQTVIGMTNPRVAVGLDLQAATLHSACAGSTIEHLVYVSLQTYQPVLKRLGYQIKLWQHRDPAAGSVQHVLLNDLLERAPARPPTVEPDPNSTAVLQATGGTTGTLKLAQLTHRTLLANVMQVTALESARPGQERVFAVLPMFHVYGLTLCLLTAIFNASTIIMMTRFSAEEMLELIRKHRPTICPIVPAICDGISALLEKERAEDPAKGRLPAGLRLCISGAAPLTRETADRFHDLTGATVIEGYGLTEASPVTHAGLPNNDVRPGSIGVPLPDTRARIADLDDPTRDVAPGEPGELLINGPQIMTGYFANPEQTRRVLFTDAHGDIWLRTGDVARMDSDGFFYLLDRKKDMIIRAGMKVFPIKVERVLRTHKQVQDVAVIGRPDPVHTEAVVAVISPQPPMHEREKLAAELRLLCRQHLAPYEVPQVIEFVPALPRSALGKLLKRELRKGEIPAGEPAVLPDPAGAIPRGGAARAPEVPPAKVPDSVGGRFKDLSLEDDVEPFPTAAPPKEGIRRINGAANGNGNGKHVKE
ncbi:MAG TPA: AMP-binding protein [Tepidisphaeraceae bacterium]|jgi:long-chain acyl-CoA synthetase|nr:AMP-binding protein [Tepidisphaeraceae bacterium]